MMAVSEYSTPRIDIDFFVTTQVVVTLLLTKMGRSPQPNPALHSGRQGIMAVGPSDLRGCKVVFSNMTIIIILLNKLKL